MLIPHRELSAEALQGVIEEFVTRDGTDYGEVEVGLAEKVALVKRQLDAGLAAIVFDPRNGSLSIQPCDGRATKPEPERVFPPWSRNSMPPLASFLLIPVLTVLTGVVFNAIDPENADG